MTTPAEMMRWTAEEHRGAAVDLGLYAVGIIDGKRGLLTDSQLEDVNLGFQMAQLHATLALSAPGLPASSGVTYNISNEQLPLDLPEYL